MAVVKNRLKVFETSGDQENMASTKPPTPLKPSNIFAGQNISPVLQKFMNKQNEIIGERNTPGSGPPSTEVSVKKTPPVPVKTAGTGLMGSSDEVEHNENTTPTAAGNNKAGLSKPVAGAAKPTDGRRGSQLVVPSIFQQDESVNTATPADGPRGSQVGVHYDLKQSLKNTSSEVSTSHENSKPKPNVKPGSSFPPRPPGLKPQASGSSKPGVPGNQPLMSQSSIRKQHEALADKKPQPTQLKESAGSGVKLPALEPVSLKHPPTTLSSSVVSSEVKGTHFRNVLRSAKVESTNQPVGKVKPGGVKPLLPPATSAGSTKVSETGSTSEQHDHSTVSDSADSKLVSQVSDGHKVAGSHSGVGGNKWKPTGQNLKRSSSSSRSPVVERKADSKQFKKVKLEANLTNSSPPTKPALPGNIDLTLVIQQYHSILKAKSNDDMNNMDNDAEGGVYDDGTSVADVVLRETKISRQSACISLIPDMTEEEEFELYDDASTPALPVPVPEADGLYVDAETERKNDDELYEDETTFAQNAEVLEEERKRRQKEEAEAKKREEKERKEKEKEEDKKRKKEEKERAKKEREEMQLRKKFNLTGDETVAGEGIVKQDVRGGVLGGLSLKKGQTVTIVRLDNNPPNKWLVKCDAGMGYIDSSNIEVDPSIIRQAMIGQARGSHTVRDGDDDDDAQPVYDDVPPDVKSHDLEDDTEIYEECP